MTVLRVDIKGVPLIGRERICGGYAGISGVTIHTATGKLRVRNNDFREVTLKPALNPPAFEQSFVTGPVIDRAEQLLAESSSLPGRFELQTTVKEIDWLSLSFDLNPSRAMYVAKSACTGNPVEDVWKEVGVVPKEKIEIDPAATVLNYGQGLFEGVKVYRLVTGEIVGFRTEWNARRLNNGAKRLCLNPVPEEMFLKAICAAVKANIELVPPPGKGAALYVRPLLFGSGGGLGVKASKENTFIVFVSPVGPYFKGGFATINLKVEKNYHRSASGIAGDVKMIGNYAPGMLVAKEAKEQGKEAGNEISEVVYLDQSNRYVEEVGAANFFMVSKKGVLYTPSLSGTILPGITRDSVIRLARHLGYRVEERRLSLDFVLMNAVEAFCCGTAAVISPIGSMVMDGERTIINQGEVGPVSAQLYRELVSIQEGKSPDPFGWVRRLEI